MELRYMSIRNKEFVRLRVCFQKHALFDAGEKISGQGGLKSIARVLDEPVVDIAPIALQVRVHAWKWTFHLLQPALEPAERENGPLTRTLSPSEQEKGNRRQQICNCRFI